MTGGTYTLLVELPEPATLEVGALGERHLPAGWYAYTGSALGAGGFARVDRHYGVAVGEREARHWHVDYLLGHDGAHVRGDVRTPDADRETPEESQADGEAVDVECAVALALPDSPIEGFGASDCDCAAHLAFDEDGDRLRAAVSEAHRRAHDD